MAMKFKTKLLFSRTGVFDSIGIGVQDPGGNVYISGRDLTLTSGNAYFDSRPLVNGFPVMLSGDTVSIDVSDLYPTNNPSGFITTGSLTGYLQLSQTGAFYPASNPSGFITGIDLSNYITNAQTGQFYPTSNPSGFLTIATVSGSYVASVTGNVSGASQIKNMIRITQSGYNALTPDAETLYIIVG